MTAMLEGRSLENIQLRLTTSTNRTPLRTVQLDFQSSIPDAPLSVRFLRTSKSFEQLPLNLRFVGVIKLESAKLWPFKPSRKAVLRRKSTLLDKYFSRRTRLGNKKRRRRRERERGKRKRKKRREKRKIQTMHFKYFLGTKSREGY